MPRTSHPRLVLAIALFATIAGVAGESISGSTLMHLGSVVCVVLGLLAAVVVAPSVAGDEIERAPTTRSPQPPSARESADARAGAATKPAAPRPPRV